MLSVVVITVQFRCNMFHALSSAAQSPGALAEVTLHQQLQASLVTVYILLGASCA